MANHCAISSTRLLGFRDPLKVTARNRPTVAGGVFHHRMVPDVGQKFPLNLGTIRTHEETDMKRTRFTGEQVIGILRKSGVSAKCGS